MAIQYTGVMTGCTSSEPGTAGLVPAPLAGDNNKYLKGDGSYGVISDFTRQYWDSTNSISLSLAANKNYIVWTSGSSAGTTGAIMDATYGSLIFVSNEKYAIIHKGTDITVSENNSTLTVSSSSDIAMAIVEL